MLTEQHLIAMTTTKPLPPTFWGPQGSTSWIDHWCVPQGSANRVKNVQVLLRSMRRLQKIASTERKDSGDKDFTAMDEHLGILETLATTIEQKHDEALSIIKYYTAKTTFKKPGQAEQLTRMHMALAPEAKWRGDELRTTGPIREAILAAVVFLGGEIKYGPPPPGALERAVQDLLKAQQG